jgi:L-fuconate dehydratase
MAAADVMITDVVTRDVRFHTSKGKHGSDAMSPDPEYSCVYIVLITSERGLEGHGFTFSIGRGNEIMHLAAEVLKHKLIGRKLGDITNWDTGADGKKYGFATLWRDLCYGSQEKWCGPEKGPVHQAAAGIINAVWDLWAKSEGKPVWQLVADMPNEQLVGCLDFRYVSDVITKEEAIAILDRESAGIADRIEEMKTVGHPVSCVAQHVRVYAYMCM